MAKFVIHVLVGWVPRRNRLTTGGVGDVNHSGGVCRTWHVDWWGEVIGIASADAVAHLLKATLGSEICRLRVAVVIVDGSFRCRKKHHSRSNGSQQQQRKERDKQGNTLLTLAGPALRRLFV